MYGKCINQEEDKTITLLDRVRKAWYNQGIKLEEEGGEVEEVQAADGYLKVLFWVQFCF